MGHLKFAVEVGLKGDAKGAIFDALGKAFGAPEFDRLLNVLSPVYIFRNKFIAHQEKEEIVDKEVARSQLKRWIETLGLLHQLRSTN